MALYYFDTSDKAFTIVDDEGTDLPDCQAACTATTDWMAFIVRDLMAGEKGEQASIKVGDQGGTTIFAVTVFVSRFRHSC